MSRNIRTLFNFDPPVTPEEIQAVWLQFVEKLVALTNHPKRMKIRFCPPSMRSPQSLRVLFIHSKQPHRPSAGKKKPQKPERGIWRDSAIKIAKFVSDTRSSGHRRRPQKIEKTLRSFFQRLAARANQVQTPVQRLRIGDLHGPKFPAPQLADYGQLRQKCQAQSAQDHPFAGFDAFHFQNYIWQQACPAKQSVRQRPVARSAVVENQRQRS